jgi:hypothetical protein
MHKRESPRLAQQSVGLHLVAMVLAGAMLAGCQSGPVVAGKVVCADGRPGGGAVVTVIAYDQVRMSGRLEPRKMGQVRADQNGAFSARVSGAPEYVVLAARKPGWAIGWEGWNPDRPSRRVRIRLKPPAALTGRVVDEAGKPVPGAKVWPAGRGISGEDIEGFEALTDKDGRFAFHDMPPGAKVQLQVLAAGYAKTDSGRQEGDVVAPCQDIELKLSPQARQRRGAGRPRLAENLQPHRRARPGPARALPLAEHAGGQGHGGHERPAGPAGSLGFRQRPDADPGRAGHAREA